MPTVPAAAGFSPEARSRRPQRVRIDHVREDDDQDVADVHVRPDENRIGPRTGMSDRNGRRIGLDGRRRVELRCSGAGRAGT